MAARKKYSREFKQDAVRLVIEQGYNHRRSRRMIALTRYTEPDPELKLLLERLRLELPVQPPPKITAAQAATATPV